MKPSPAICKLSAMIKSNRASVWFLAVLMLSVCMGCHFMSTHFSHAATAHPDMNSCLVYIGTFTFKQSKGIYAVRMSPKTGALGEPELVAESQSPSYLALHPNGRFLYCVNEIDRFDGKRGGAVSAFSINLDSGRLTLLNQAPSGGVGPTHISIDRRGMDVLVANYGSGSVAVLPVEADGKVAEPSSVDQHEGKGTDPARQEGPHAHCANLDPSNRFALSADLGLDKAFVYRFDAVAGTITPNTPPAASIAPGSGPRHLAFDPAGKNVYVLNEMGATITACHYDPAHGVLSEFQTISTVPEGFSGAKGSAEIMVHPSGRFLYASNRGDSNDIAIFRIDSHSGQLTFVDRVSTQGKAPRGFGINPTGQWLLAANQDTDNVIVFRIDQNTGKLTSTGTNLHVPTPVCIVFLTPKS